MSKISCEKCGKEFNSKSHYTQHQKRKTPCIVEEKLTKLSASLYPPIDNPAVIIQPIKKITIDTATFDEIKKYYDGTLNIDKSTYKSSNDEPTPIDCISEMISKIPEELWRKSDLSILDPCCGNGNFSLPILFELLKYHDKRTILEKMLEYNDINESTFRPLDSCSTRYVSASSCLDTQSRPRDALLGDRDGETGK